MTEQHTQKLADKYYIDQAIRLRDTDALIEIVKTQQAIMQQKVVPQQQKTKDEEFEALQAKNWTARKRLAEKLHAITDEIESYAVWQGDDGEKRVYLNMYGNTTRTVRTVTYYASGNMHNPPQSAVFVQYKDDAGDLVWPKERREAAKVVIKEIAAAWKRLPSVDCATALSYVEPKAEDET